MKRSCISLMADRFRVTSRSATGLALTFDPVIKRWYPKLIVYCAGFSLIMENHGTKSWGMVTIPDGEPVDPGAFTDAQNIWTPATWTLDHVITGSEFTTVMAGIATTDLTPVFFDGMTFRQMLLALSTELGQSPLIDPDRAFA
jgi:hypothetical protein